MSKNILQEVSSNSSEGIGAFFAEASRRKSISYELNPNYYKVAEMRLTDIISESESIDFVTDKRVVEELALAA
jgi:hypothetical protein